MTAQRSVVFAEPVRTPISTFGGSLKDVEARAPRPEEPPGGERRSVEATPERKGRDLEPEHAGAQEPRRGLLRRHPFASVVWLFLLVVGAAGGSLYWDYARHFQSTDDAFIAARQYAIAPKISGYITAVPVTDNQHVAAGGIIARIDERDYRVALEQADAQVAAAKAGMDNIDAQMTVQEAQIAANEALVHQAEAALVFNQWQAEKYQKLVEQDSGSVQNAQQYISQLHQQEAAVKSAQAT